VPAPSAVPFVGLTGGMGAGKSTALAVLERLGAATLSTDAVVHELYAGDRMRDAVIARWGAELVPEGVVDRAAVAQRVFADPGERRWLEGLLWPLVGERITVWLDEVRACAPPPRAAVVEIPLLFEAGMESGFDATIAIVAREELRRERAEGRGHVLAEERVARQLTQEEKAQRATFAVHNDGDMQELERGLSAILVKLEE
jgi:dephospho-CoA kinase